MTSDAQMPTREEQRRLYAEYEACTTKARQDITNTEKYQTKFAAATRRTKLKYLKRDLNNLENAVQEHVKSACAASLGAITEMADTACLKEIALYNEAVDAYQSCMYTRLHSNMPVESMMRVIVNARRARQAINECHKIYHDGLKEELRQRC